MKSGGRKPAQCGLGLVELMVLGAAIGILAAIAVPPDGSVGAMSETVAAKRNAQTLCMLYKGARGAGADFDSNTKAGVVDELIEGKTIADAIGSRFKMSPLSDRAKARALDFVDFDADVGVMNFVESQRKPLGSGRR